MAKTLLTPKNIAFIKANRLLMSGSDMAAKFGIDKNIVGRYMRKNGLAVPKELVYKWRAKKMYKPFTLLEDKYIVEHIDKQSIKQMAPILHRSASYVSCRAKELGLSEIIKQNALASQIKKGNVPVNKGKKIAEYMSADQIEKTKSTRIKKGHTQHKAVGFNDGDIVIRQSHKKRNYPPYKWIRISKSNWKMLHVYNWEKVHGPVPKNHIIIFKNGDTMNCDISNLEQISLQENMLRNSASLHLTDNYLANAIAGKKNKELAAEIVQHKDLIELKRHQLLLNRQIKNHDTGANTKTA